MNDAFSADPTCLPQVEILLVARRTVDHMVPLLVVFAVLEKGRSAREIPQNLGLRTAAPFGVGVRSLHSLLVFTLQAIPLLFRSFAVHARQQLWHMPPRMQGLLSTILREVLFDPSPESFLHRLRLRIMERPSDFFPSVPLAQHLEDLTDLITMVHLDPALDQLDQ
jgi:hypothetical protein